MGVITWGICHTSQSGKFPHLSQIYITGTTFLIPYLTDCRVASVEWLAVQCDFDRDLATRQVFSLGQIPSLLHSRRHATLSGEKRYVTTLITAM